MACQEKNFITDDLIKGLFEKNLGGIKNWRDYVDKCTDSNLYYYPGINFHEHKFHLTQGKGPSLFDLSVSLFDSIKDRKRRVSFEIQNVPFFQNSELFHRTVCVNALIKMVHRLDDENFEIAGSFFWEDANLANDLSFSCAKYSVIRRSGIIYF